MAKRFGEQISPKATTHLALNGLRIIYSRTWTSNYKYLASLGPPIISSLTLAQQVLYLNFKGEKNLWQRGDFANQSENNTLLVDPWSGTGDVNAPFDQSFYLILNVAVGSRNGWFL